MGERAALKPRLWAFVEGVGSGLGDLVQRLFALRGFFFDFLAVAVGQIVGIIALLVHLGLLGRGTSGARLGSLLMAPSAHQAYADAGSGNNVTGWKLDREQRRALIERFAPRFRNLVADHVTLAARAADDAPLPQETEGLIVGRVDDGRGVEAMIVSIDGSTDRPDGSYYHITWSLADGRQAKESNDVLAAQKWVMFETPIPIKLQPARFR